MNLRHFMANTPKIANSRELSKLVRGKAKSHNDFDVFNMRLDYRLSTVEFQSIFAYLQLIWRTFLIYRYQLSAVRIPSSWYPNR